ncbi:hypothetical protein BKA66DRAFT_574412 [Pyrenochaeta sp. MPI-SDFR-AT-0127]|nr:hypothetical protein BKA66DRAFT_574412 [Pyrenochaeta sp. MPI-SDFR-AT-0127]
MSDQSKINYAFYTYPTSKSFIPPTLLLILKMVKLMYFLGITLTLGAANAAPSGLSHVPSNPLLESRQCRVNGCKYTSIYLPSFDSDMDIKCLATRTVLTGTRALLSAVLVGARGFSATILQLVVSQ